MHELSITQDIVELVSGRAGGRKVTRVALEIGQVSSIVPDAIRFCFDSCCKGTRVEGAELEIEEIPGRARCQDCGSEFELEQPFGMCACGSWRIKLIAGDQLRVKEMEVA